MRVITLFVAVLTAASANSQGKYGLDEQLCKENLSMFREYYKQKNYEDAYTPWLWAFINCPASSQNIYKNGPKILKHKLKYIDVEYRSDYIDTLMLIFDQRIQYFGKRGYVLGLKGYTLVDVEKGRSEEAFGYLGESLDLDENNASVQAVYGYMKAIVNMEKMGDADVADVLAAYDRISEIIEYNIVNESKATKNFIKFSETIEQLFAPYANCDDLITLFSKNFNSKTDDVTALNRLTKLLSEKECVDSDLFFEASSRLYQLQPTASSAYQMAKMSISRGDRSNAILFAKEAVDFESDDNKKAKYYLLLADAYRSKGSYSSARDAVYKSLDLKNGWGEAYMSLGNIYVAGAKSCGNNFDMQSVYWVAVDAFRKALSDPETNQRASKSINTYSKYFPTTEDCFFNGLKDGGKYTVGCWINKATTVRTSD